MQPEAILGFFLPMFNFRPTSIIRSLIFLAGFCATLIVSGQNRAKVDFQREIQPILERLSDEEKASLLNWLEQGAEIPEGIGLLREPGEELHGQALFEFEIAPLLAKHCLECHDSSRKEGALDLSRKASAFKGEIVVKPFIRAMGRIARYGNSWNSGTCRKTVRLYRRAKRPSQTMD